MKITRYFMAAAAVLASLTACDSDLEKVVYNPADAEAGSLTASVADIQLTAATTKQEVLTLSWGASKYGIPVAVTYTVEMDEQDGDFSNPYTLAATTDTEVTFKGSELNKAVLALEELKHPDTELSYEAQQVKMRVVSSFNEDVEDLLTNVVNLTITPYAGKLEFAKMAVPGGHNGWAPDNYTQALYATDSRQPNVYEGYVYMAAGNEFKIADGSWDTNWGSDDKATLVPDGSNITVDEEGCYYIKVDLDALTIQIEKRNWSLVGSAIEGDSNWGTDLDMEYDAVNNIYRATYDFQYGGEFKFRANHDWAVNYGGDPDGEPGDLKLGGDNLTPLPGEYTVTLSFVDGYPTYNMFAGAEVDTRPYIYLSLPGTMNGWNAGTEDNVVFDFTKKGISYSGWIYASGDDEFKIADGSWDVNWGSADLATLVAGGDNIKPEAGMYKIDLNIDELTMALTKTSWSIVGDAVAGDTNWGTDYDLAWNADDKVLEGTFNLNAGAWKFRANYDWAINLGGNGEEGGLSQDGANLSIDEDGTYHITLDLQTRIGHTAPTYTITKQ